MRYMLAGIVAMVAGFMLRAAPVHAAWAGSEGMAAQLMCEVYTLTSGTMMLMVGFLVAVYGLYIMVIKSGYTWGIVLIIAGALLTALPGLVVSTLRGTSVFLEESGITSADAADSIRTILTNITSYAGRCDQIAVDMTMYNEIGMEYFNPISSFNARGSGIIAPVDPNTPPPDTSRVGMQGACVDKIVEPLDRPAALGSQYGMRTMNGVRRLHAGVDIPEGGIPGRAIMAESAGKVTTAWRSSSYGNVVYISHPGNRETRYAHMRDQPLVSVGQSVPAGQVLGYMGNTGKSTGPHLHFEWRENNAPVNPVPKLGC